MDIDIAGKVVVVTGGAQGIGRALALGLAAEGARVAVLARDRQRARAVVDEIGGLPGAPPGLALEADVSDEAAVIEAAAEVDTDRVPGKLAACVASFGDSRSGCQGWSGGLRELWPAAAGAGLPPVARCPAPACASLWITAIRALGCGQSSVVQIVDVPAWTIRTTDGARVRWGACDWWGLHWSGA
jgi:NAD(P)-dependent dehydrogenase (short-subunit alcohol dehydrogenase family)